MNPSKKTHSGLLVVGGSGGTHLGDSFCRAGRILGIETELSDIRAADGLFRVAGALTWRLLRRPAAIGGFERKVLAQCRLTRPAFVLTTGLAPLRAKVLKSLREEGVTTLNFLTDDPWNPAHASRWFFEAAPEYDRIFSPRRSNLGDLRKLGCKNVAYLPFAVQDEHFYPVSSVSAQDFDVMFAGNADAERVPWISALAKAGFKTAIYGDYWERFPATRQMGKGRADTRTLRTVMASAKVSLCLVRRANRDGHCMRTFEIPAVGGFMLTEDTLEHRELFGTEGRATLYFSSIEEMLDKTRWAIARPEERRRMADEARRLIAVGRNTYRDRLETMLKDGVL